MSGIKIEIWMTGGLAVAAAVLLLAAPATAADPNTAAARTCESVILDDIDDEMPKAKSVELDIRGAEEHEIKNGLKIVGQGSYKGDSGKKRTFTFECTYNNKNNKVESATWKSSFNNRKYTAVQGTSSSSSSNSSSSASEADVHRACKSAIDAKVRKDFEHKIQKIEMVEDTLKIRERGGVHTLSGQGRFLGGGGGWHRFELTCEYDDEDEEVTDTSWKHLGNEKDLDLD